MYTGAPPPEPRRAGEGVPARSPPEDARKHAWPTGHIHVCLSLSLYIYIYMYMYMYIYIYVYLSLSIYTYIYIYSQFRPSGFDAAAKATLAPQASPSLLVGQKI